MERLDQGRSQTDQKLPFSKVLSVRINSSAVEDSAPPHAIVFERDPYVPAGGIQEAAECIEVLSGALFRSELCFHHLLDPGEIRL